MRYKEDTGKYDYNHFDIDNLMTIHFILIE